MDDSGGTREDMQLPKGTEDAEKLADTLKEHHSNGEEVVVTVTKVGCCAEMKDLISFFLSEKSI